MLYIDCSRGISGDMFVGALLDAGADGGRIIDVLSGIAKISVRRVSKAGVLATRFKVYYPAKKEEYSSLTGKVKSLSLRKKTEETALNILKKLAEAEAKVHGVSVEEVHLHEAADSVVDAVAAALALEELNLLGGEIAASTVSVGALADATSELLKAHSIPVRHTSGEEITTPTGAAILAALAPSYTEEPCIEGCQGFGAGEKDFQYPNVLRVAVGRRLALLESNIDDVSPEILAYAQEKLMLEGALDVHVIPCLMKKGRLGHLVRILSSSPEKHARMLMEETNTLGVREFSISRRYNSERKIKKTSIKLKDKKEFVQVKESDFGVKPEFDDVRKLAQKYNLPARKIKEKILRRAL
jgi:uncharacterized protein (TIGR00299 family) protein